MKRTRFLLITLSIFLSINSFGGENSEASDEIMLSDHEDTTVAVIEGLAAFLNTGVLSLAGFERDEKKVLDKAHALWNGQRELKRLGMNSPEEYERARVAYEKANTAYNRAFHLDEPNFRQTRIRLALLALDVYLIGDFISRLNRKQNEEGPYPIVTPFTRSLYETIKEGDKEVGTALFPENSEPVQHLRLYKESTH